MSAYFDFCIHGGSEACFVLFSCQSTATYLWTLSLLCYNKIQDITFKRYTINCRK